MKSLLFDEKVIKKLDNIEIYKSIRNEILRNHTLMHYFSVVVILTLLTGIWLIEGKDSVLSVFLPLLSIAWASAMVRFDFLIHRQIAYLQKIRIISEDSQAEIPIWENWKSSLKLTNIIMPITDSIILLVVIVPTIYLVFGPAQDYFNRNNLNGAIYFAWGITLVLILLLCFLTIVPTISGFRKRT